MREAHNSKIKNQKSKLRQRFAFCLDKIAWIKIQN